MYLFKDNQGNYILRFRGETWMLPAKTIQSAVYYIGQHLDKLVPTKVQI